MSLDSEIMEKLVTIIEAINAQDTEITMLHGKVDALLGENAALNRLIKKETKKKTSREPKKPKQLTSYNAFVSLVTPESAAMAKRRIEEGNDDGAMTAAAYVKYCGRMTCAGVLWKKHRSVIAHTGTAPYPDGMTKRQFTAALKKVNLLETKMARMVQERYADALARYAVTQNPTPTEDKEGDDAVFVIQAGEPEIIVRDEPVSSQDDESAEEEEEEEEFVAAPKVRRERKTRTPGRTSRRRRQRL